MYHRKSRKDGDKLAASPSLSPSPSPLTQTETTSGSNLLDEAPLPDAKTLRYACSWVTGRSMWLVGGEEAPKTPARDDNVDKSRHDNQSNAHRLSSPRNTNPLRSKPLQPIRLSDGPHGIRKPLKDLSLHDSHPATCFPTAAALATSWDERVVHKVGRALAREARYYGVAVVLGPGMNLKRHPCGGRNFEYFSEDPLLTARLATAHVQGIQSHQPDSDDGTTVMPVSACPKHYAINNQEGHRFVVNALVDERTAREMYLRHFQYVIRHGRPRTMMCAYNRVNGVFCSEHITLNQTILRQDFGFDGVLMTDWGATHDRAAGLTAGVDLEMPGSHGVQTPTIRTALHQGTLVVDDLLASGQRVQRLVVEHQPNADNDGSNEIRNTEAEFWAAHHDLAYETALECAVLLQNRNGTLPLPRNLRVALIGDFAKDHARYQGMGSSQVSTDSVRSAYDQILHYTPHVTFCRGYHYDNDHVEDVDPAAIDEAVSLAKAADVTVLFVGLPECMESEGFDRDHLHLPAQHNALVDAVCSVAEEGGGGGESTRGVVVVLCNGGPVELPWADRPAAILEGYLLGEAGGAALVDLVFGAQSPCGKLAETFPYQQRDALADRYFPGTSDRVEHREGLNIGYRYFDTAGIPVRFAFGYGLTYTTFNYDALQVQVGNTHGEEENNHDNGRTVHVQVSLRVTNTGSVTAKEIVQCYVHAMDSAVYRPNQVLVDFTKIMLKPGQSTAVRFDLYDDAFNFYDVGRSKWIVEDGTYEIRVGSSSSAVDLRLRQPIHLSTGQTASTLAIQSYPRVDDPQNALTLHVSDATFLGRFVTDFGSADDLRLLESPPITPFHRNTLLKDLAELRWLGRFLAWIVYLGASAEVKPGPGQARQKRMAKIVVANLPLRTLVQFSQGNMSYELLDALLALLNYDWRDAVVRFLRLCNPCRRR